MHPVSVPVSGWRNFTEIAAATPIATAFTAKQASPYGTYYIASLLQEWLCFFLFFLLFDMLAAIR